MDYQPLCQTEVQFLSKYKMEEQLLNLSCLNIVLILNASSAKRWNLHKLLQTLNKQNNIIWINDVKPNPTPEEIQNAWIKIGVCKIDLILTIGGGSAIDLAKGISAFYEDNSSSRTAARLIESIKQKSYQQHNKFIDIIAIPTTAGTGSELTPWATIWDMNKYQKHSIDHPALKPKKAIIVPELTMSLSKDMTLSSGLDTLSHAMEAYWSIHTNPLVQELSSKAIQLILENLILVLAQPHNLLLRENMCKASVIAALAFSHTRTTACHSISYPMTMYFGVPHGLAVAVTLGKVGERNKGSFPNDEAFYKLFKPYGGIQAWLDDVSVDIIKLRLSSFQIFQKDIDLLVNNSFTGGRMDNNPVILSEQEVKEILEDLIY
jgi:alcohol dehydrogenase class IV